jgi:hypothetical protein
MAHTDQQVVQHVERLRAQLKALPDSTASDRARATLEELRELLGRAGYHFERSPEEKAGRSDRLAARQHEVERNTARASGAQIKG